tara:strand:+ start:205 stop:495 length:291 start_codon:yes stop_codon:yes gene_type:complete
MTASDLDNASQVGKVTQQSQTGLPIWDEDFKSNDCLIRIPHFSRRALDGQIQSTQLIRNISKQILAIVGVQLKSYRPGKDILSLKPRSRLQLDALY